MDKSLITSSTSLFALLISPFSSAIADRLGRKRVILYADILFIVGAVIQAACSSVPSMIAGRCVIGAAVGAASFVVPLYIAELSPASHRGRLVTANVLFITLGQVVAYVVGWAFSTYGAQDAGWRWMVGIGAMPAGLQAAVIAFMPESPRWLVKMGRSGQAQSIIRRVNGGVTATQDASTMIREIEMEVREEEEARHLRNQQASKWKWLDGWRDLVGDGRNRRALAIACLLQGLQQLCGFVCTQFVNHSHAIEMWLISSTEFADVLFSHYFHGHWIPQSHTDISHSSSHQFLVHTCRFGTC